MKPHTATPRADIYTRVTDRVISALEQGVRPWLKPWTAGNTGGRIALPLRHNGVPYQGVNVLILWGEALDKGYLSPFWLTYRQAAELGATVRRGEHGSTIVYADRITRTETDDAGNDVEKTIPFLKAYTVFNAEQIDGLPAHYTVKPEARPEPQQLADEAERFFTATGAVIRHGGSEAYYAPGPDIICLPPASAFRDAESYAATKAHEVTHWTGHKSRLDREFGKRFGDTGYAREELVAELGAAFLCAALGITPEPREDHAAYLQSWLKTLREDKRAIFSAASHAQRAVDYLHGLQPSDTPSGPGAPDRAPAEDALALPA